MLEDWLSIKNEKLLEKELVYEEVTKLCDKYWEIAQDKWHSTLVNNQNLGEIIQKTWKIER